MHTPSKHNMHASYRLLTKIQSAWKSTVFSSDDKSYFNPIVSPDLGIVTLPAKRADTALLMAFAASGSP